MRRLILLLAFYWAVQCSETVPTIVAQPPGDEPQQILALFRAHCVECHGTEKPKARLELSSFASLARGGRKGPVIVPGDLGKSLLWQMISDEKMPPEKPLVAKDRQLLERWIKSGSPGLIAKDGTTNPGAHWAFQPVKRPAMPEPKDKARLRNAIDAHVQEALERKQLSLSQEADRETLLRRVTFDLLGLPPTSNDRLAYLADKMPGAFERLVDRLLNSEHYGERWGKYWLDVAGYADSNGYFSADSDRPLAYRYRDYVIRAFNQDKPYDRFIHEQLAGDELAGFDPKGDMTPETIELLTATHYLRNAPDGTGESDGNPDEVLTDRFTVLEGNVQILMNGLLGVTIQCARCHDHKFEPITQKEYYQLQAILYPVYCPERWRPPNERVVAIAGREEREKHAKQTEFVTAQVKAYQASIDSIALPLRDRLLEERLPALSAEKRATIKKAQATPRKRRSAEQQALLTAHPQAEIADGDLQKRFPEFAAVQDAIKKAIAAAEQQRPAPLTSLAAFFETDPNPPAHHVLERGKHNAPGAEVGPGVPIALTASSNPFQIPPRSPKQLSTGRRLALARWITSRENPVFARVMVNRIWQQHFGIGLVPTPDNFGRSGTPPSHPELLDYLASEFVRSGYSIKALHRHILTSATYRQSSAINETALAIDPDNRLLWHYPLRRLDAEAIRDAMLAVAGELDPRMGGPFVATRRVPEGSVEVDESRAGARRRSVYLQQKRTQVTTLLDLFDAPSIVANCAFRTSSTVPLQSLALLNSTFARLRAQAFARRLAESANSDPGARLRMGFVLALGRQPLTEEFAAAQRFLQRQRLEYASQQDSEQRAWVDLCQMILASNAFLYLD